MQRFRFAILPYIRYTRVSGMEQHSEEYVNHSSEYEVCLKQRIKLKSFKTVYFCDITFTGNNNGATFRDRTLRTIY